MQANRATIRRLGWSHDHLIAFTKCHVNNPVGKFVCLIFDVTVTRFDMLASVEPSSLESYWWTHEGLDYIHERRQEIYFLNQWEEVGIRFPLSIVIWLKYCSQCGYLIHQAEWERIISQCGYDIHQPGWERIISQCGYDIHQPEWERMISQCGYDIHQPEWENNFTVWCYMISINHGEREWSHSVDMISINHSERE